MSLDKKINHTFLRSNDEIECIFNTSNVDFANQHRGNYIFEKWCGSNKWWMDLFFWNHGDINMSTFEMCAGANVGAWLSCGEKDKEKCLHDNCEFNKGSFIKMINP